MLRKKTLQNWRPFSNPHYIFQPLFPPYSLDLSHVHKIVAIHPNYVGTPYSPLGAFQISDSYFTKMDTSIGEVNLASCYMTILIRLYSKQLPSQLAGNIACEANGNIVKGNCPH